MESSLAVGVKGRGFIIAAPHPAATATATPSTPLARPCLVVLTFIFSVEPPVVLCRVLDVIEAQQPLIPLVVAIDGVEIVIGGQPSAARLVIVGTAPRPRLARPRLLGAAGRPFLTTLASPIQFPRLALSEFAGDTVGLVPLAARRSRPIVVAAAAAATP